ncbi:hypothetical protein KY330_00145 [Candidatus Woesearchaeota archaeon]|nr:hypothetical protein [Candidatus Woesearchaeota archaeon]
MFTLATMLTGVKEYFLANLWPRFLELVYVPVKHPETIWIITPLVVTLILMQFYFGRYSKEELGWNTAFGNSIVLLFISIDLFRHIYGQPGYLDLFSFSTIIMKTLVASLVGLTAVWMSFLNFFHVLPEKLAFILSSSLPNNLIAYVGIAVVYSDIVFDGTTLLAALMLFAGLWLIFTIVKLLEPKATEKIVKTITRKKKK